MRKMQLFIKNMVCDRCKMVVKAELEAAGLHPVSVELGVVALDESEITEEKSTKLGARLTDLGFELLEDRRRQLVEAIKTTVIELIHGNSDDTRLKQSEYISQRLHYDYPYLSKLFSETVGTTIEQFTIHQRIERVKELLTYGEHTLSEIAYELGYSSVAALSGQFKKVTGMNPSAWKSGNNIRQTLDTTGI
ncbi:MAG: AraC family transcriptional regulator [Sphingobacteriales bacterium]|nr:MAG: AraC family transcriptional regulator [Sphingobacteriales bacterium]